jgi:hypothetical protein
MTRMLLARLRNAARSQMSAAPQVVADRGDEPTDEAMRRIVKTCGSLPLPDCVGQVGHPLRRLRADRLQRHAARVHALEQADSGAEQHG